MSEKLAVGVGVRYRLEQLLGQGGMGSVYRALDRLTGQRVALKLVPVDQLAELSSGDGSTRLSSDDTDVLELSGLARGPHRSTSSARRWPALAETMAGHPPAIGQVTSALVHIAVSPAKSSPRLLWARMALAQEFRTLATLRHPHIISVLDYGFIARSQPFFTMELLQAPQNLTAASKDLGLEGKALLLAQLLRALSYLHRHGIVHRDLKPGNVMVLAGSEGPIVKLLDFGLAVTRFHVPTKLGETAGTLSYMAPEIFEARPASEAADLFAFGVIAYELFAGRHPFDRGDDSRLVAAILSDDPDWTPLQPYPALVDLLRRLLAKAPADRPSADAASSALLAAAALPPAPETVALREATLQSARFVGREEPMAALREALDAAGAGMGEVRLLAGESGVGKSRLIEELRTYALVRGVLSVRGQATSEGGAAYSVWIETLLTLCLCTELAALDASVIKSIVPDLEVLLEREIPNAPALNAQAAALRLVKVIESLILSRTEPVLLLLEDLHWADAESLALLRHLAPSCRERPILIVASYRDDERPNLPQELPGCAVLKLPRLAAGGITELCRSVLGPTGCTPELVAFLDAETEGNAFFIIEVMRALAEDAGQLSLVASKHLPQHVSTGGIQGLVQRRLARLPQEARPLLRLAAVAGRLLDLAVLRQCEPQLDPWLYVAVDAAVLEAVDQSWRFAHDKIREELLSELDPTEKQRLHLLLARALERTYPSSGPHAATIAEHYYRGGSLAQAAFYRVEAGTYALLQGATEVAAALLSQALDPETRGLLSKVQAARAYNGLVQANLALGRIVPCIETFEDFMAQVGYPKPVGSLSLAAVASAMLARRLLPAPAVRLASEEDRRMWAEAAHAMRWATEAYIWAARPIESLVAALRGSELAEALADRGLQSMFLAMLGYVAGLVPARTASRSLFERGRRMLDELSNPRAVLDFGRVASSYYMNAADWERATAQLDSLLALSRQVGDEYSLTFALAVRLVLAFRQDDAAMIGSTGPALQHASRRNRISHLARVYPTYEAMRALRTGDIKSAHRHLVEAEGYIKSSQDAMGQTLVGGPAALCLLRQGDEARALDRAQQTLALAESVQLSSENFGEGLSAVCEVFLSLWESGNGAKRQQLAGPLRRTLAAMRRCAWRFPSCVPRTLLWHGRHARNHGATQLARTLGEASQRSAKRVKMPFDEALARTWLERFAQAPPGAESSLSAELRGIIQLLARGFG